MHMNTFSVKKNASENVNKIKHIPEINCNHYQLENLNTVSL